MAAPRHPAAGRVAARPVPELLPRAYVFITYFYSVTYVESYVGHAIQPGFGRAPALTQGSQPVRLAERRPLMKHKFTLMDIFIVLALVLIVAPIVHPRTLSATFGPLRGFIQQHVTR